MNNQSGNALFLILIAVALFAALSYAVTQSGRGGGSATKEQAMIAAAQITQYGAALENAMTRMILTGTPAASIAFCSTGGINNPATNCIQVPTTNERCSTGSDCIFASEGGGVAPVETAGAAWYIYPQTAPPQESVNGVGTTANDVVFLVGGFFSPLTLDICNAINQGLGLGTPPVQDDVAAGINPYPGEYAACYIQSGNPAAYTYYHVLQAN